MTSSMTSPPPPPPLPQSTPVFSLHTKGQQQEFLDHARQVQARQNKAAAPYVADAAAVAARAADVAVEAVSMATVSVAQAALREVEQYDRDGSGGDSTRNRTEMGTALGTSADGGTNADFNGRFSGDPPQEEPGAWVQTVEVSAEEAALTMLKQGHISQAEYREAVARSRAFASYQRHVEQQQLGEALRCPDPFSASRSEFSVTESSRQTKARLEKAKKDKWGNWEPDASSR
jgi:hypothetical protein